MNRLCKQPDMLEIPDTVSTLEKCEYFLNLASSEVNVLKFSWLIGAFLEAAYSYFDVSAINATLSNPSTYASGSWERDEIFDKLLNLVHIKSTGPFGVTTAVAPYSPTLVKQLFKFHERYIHHFPLAILTGGPNLPEDFLFGDSIRNGAPVLEFCRKLLVFLREDWLRGAKGFDQVEETEEVKEKKITMNYDDPFFQASQMEAYATVSQMGTLCKELDIVAIPRELDIHDKCKYFLNLASNEVNTHQFSWLIGAFLEAAYSYFDVSAISATHAYTDSYTGGTWGHDDDYYNLGNILYVPSAKPFGVSTEVAPHSPLIVRNLFQFHERYIHHFPLAILTGGPNLPEDFLFGDSIRNGAPVLEFCRRAQSFLGENWQEKYGQRFPGAVAKPKIKTETASSGSESLKKEVTGIEEGSNIFACVKKWFI